MNNHKKINQIFQKKPSKHPFSKRTRFNFFRTANGVIFIILACLIAIIIAIPSLIVLPHAKESIKTQEATVQVETVEEVSEDPVSVPVLRTASEKVENVPLETYVARVVASEMPAEFEIEALKAQSLAARTYVINYMLQQESDKSLSITDEVEHQVYKNDTELREQWGEDYQWKMDKIIQATQATEGEILAYNDELITPVYFSTSNGYTENSEEYWQTEIPYLRSVSSPWDEQSPKFKDQRTFSVVELSTALNIDLQPGITHKLEITKTTGNRVKQLMINDHNFSGREVREKLNLPSSDFSIEQKGDYFIFTTRGFGHGVGMSQYGANGMAKEGKTYEQIIDHYYKDVEVLHLSDIEHKRLSALLE